jgi:hypothetical protein
MSPGQTSIDTMNSGPGNPLAGGTASILGGDSRTADAREGAHAQQGGACCQTGDQ